MAVLRTAHHGVHVSTLEGVAAAFRPAGFSHSVVGGVTEFRLEEGHPLLETCRKGVPTYGEEFDTFVVENPTSPQQLFLIEVKEPWLVDEPGSQPAQTDLTIVVPVQGEPDQVYGEMQAASPGVSFSDPVAMPNDDGIAVSVDGQRYILTRSSVPFAIVHYATADFPAARAFYEGMLGLALESVAPGDAAARYRVAAMDAHLEIEVRDDTPVLTPATGKRYRGGSYFRMTNIDLAKVASHDLLAPAVLDVATGRAEWFFAPDGKAGYIYGPLGEMIELFDRSVDYSVSPPYSPEVEPA